MDSNPINNLNLKSLATLEAKDSETPKEYEKDLSDWLLTQMGEGQWQPGDNPQDEGWFRSNIADKIFARIDSGMITNMDELKEYVKNNLMGKLGPDIYKQDPYLAKLVKENPNAAYMYVQDLYSHLGLDPSTAPKPDSPPPPSNNFEVVDYNIRTSDASWGPDTGSRNWANRQDAIVNEITAHGMPSVINLQESTDLQLYGGKGAKGDDTKGGILGRLNAKLRASGDTQDTYKVLNSNNGEDPIIYLSGPNGVEPIPGSEGYIPISSHDQYGQRYVHIAAFTKTLPNGEKKNIIIGNGHAQMNKVGGFTKEDAAMVSQVMQEAEEAYNAKGILTMDSNYDLKSGDYNHIGGMHIGYDPSKMEGTNGVWGSGSGRLEDAEWSDINGTVTGADRHDPEAIAASDHVCLYGNYDLMA